MRSLAVWRWWWIFFGVLGTLISYAAADEPKISVVLSRSIAPYLEAVEGTREALQAAGLSAAFDVRDIKGDRKEETRIADEVVKQQPRLIITVGTEATTLMKASTNTIPIVFSMVVRAETLVKDHPSVIGASMEVPAREQLRVLQTLLPSLKRVGVIYNPALHHPDAMIRHQEAAHDLGIELVVEPVDTVVDVPPRLKTLLPTIDAFWLIPDETVLAPQMVQHILLETLRARLPVLAPSWAFVEQGALVAVGCDYRDVGRQAGELAVNVLLGRPQLPTGVVEARTTRVYVNLRTAKTLGISIPQDVMTSVDRTVR